ncbi:nuclear receptor coactivator 5 isoform X2 [Dunckerocampus dactyliophorus]|uniref:nuclear receptor coactivator 5 isoform X2 n=1 Tax=Dunckerocampus dactyliophorus TaxID=161453 RepID=UPI002406EC62|nr:nuclear receptor coactivator 5 isoform X2 [Dunckerocampus dactyliophorus]
MSSWSKSSKAGRRPPVNPNGSAQPMRLFRRSAPYPSREERTEDLKDALDSYKELEQKQNYSGGVKYEGTKHQSNATLAKPDTTVADRRKTLYQKFYRQVQEDRKPPDCVVISVTNQCLNYPKSLSQCLQERGLSVEMLYLQAESGLTRALQDVQSVGSPLCILVEQTNIALSSCTVIIFSESLKIHRNMPKDQAMDFVVAEHRRGLDIESPERDPADIAAQASQLLGDFLDREKIERHIVPSEVRQFLQLLTEGVHLYPEELEAISQYVQSRQEHIEASNNSKEEKDKVLPSVLGKPPPLLPTPPGPPQSPCEAGRPPPPMPLLPSPGSYPKTKPPPLLSLPPSLHNPYGGPSLHRGPLISYPPQRHPGHRGSHGNRGAPPSLKSSRPPLLSTPGGHGLQRPVVLLVRTGSSTLPSYP